MKFYKTIIALVFISTLIFGGVVIREFFIQRPDTGVMPMTFVVEKGDSVKAISSGLKDAGIIDSKFIFELYIWLFHLDKKFQPGDFYIKYDTSMMDIIRDMTTVRINEKRLTIIEGWTLRNLAEYLVEKEVIKDVDELYAYTGRPAVDYSKEKIDFKNTWDYEFLKDKPKTVNMEGYFYPDTYRILEEDGVDVLLTKALDNFDKKLTPEMRAEIKRQGKSLHEILTVASIVEKEVFTYEHRRIVSDMIWRRLRNNWALQMDSTINYFTDSGRARSTYSDLEISSPYNTYKYTGIPYGPIGNPSIWAIKATIFPKPNNYWYFLSDPQHNVYFATTYEQHLNNRQYLD